MVEFLEYFVQTFVSIFVIVDCVGATVLYLPLISKFSEKQKKNIIFMSIIVAAGTLFVMSFIGLHILNYLGIKIYSLKIAGGILLFIIAMEMLLGFDSRTKHSRHEHLSAMQAKEIAITPLAIPFLTGPGSITAGIILFNGAESIVGVAAFVLGILAVFAISYLVLVESQRVYKRLGVTGVKVITRIMGLLISALAIQLISNGISELAVVIVSLI
ncbi:MAG: NAAT family transporter [Candidatus Diapherotrites archaeon]|nr:NAAT family transporter [Candidatus Diapherotrites archaeon]